MDGWQGLWGIVFFVLGGAATELSSWNTHRRQSAAKREDLEEAVRQRGEEFELQHLVEGNQLLRSLAEREGEFIEAKWPHPLRRGSDEEIHQQAHAALRKVADAEGALSAQVGFILADPVREAVRAAVDAISDRVWAIQDAP